MGFRTTPAKNTRLVALSVMIKMKGRLHCMMKSGFPGSSWKEVNEIASAVAAAASVPFSFTSTNTCYFFGIL